MITNIVIRNVFGKKLQREKKKSVHKPFKIFTALTW